MSTGPLPSCDQSHISRNVEEAGCLFAFANEASTTPDILGRAGTRSTAGDAHTRRSMIGPAKSPPARPFAPSVGCARHARRRSIRSRGERADVWSPHAIACLTGQRRSRAVPWRDVAARSGSLTGVCGCRNERSRDGDHFGHCFLHMVTEAKQARLPEPGATIHLEYFITAHQRIASDRPSHYAVILLRSARRSRTAPGLQRPDG
jgi:hypothetical protein